MKYWAFVSYSHQDRKWGDWLHHALETYRVPKNLVGKETNRDHAVPAGLYPVFRDREELPTSAELGEQLREALEQSRYLIVICSPAAAKSRWVNEEVLTFKRDGRSDRILAFIVDGEPNSSEIAGREDEECFPPALRFQIGEDGELTETPVEPIAADAREIGDGRANAKLKLLAGLLGVGFDDLRQREQERKLKRLRAIVAFTSLLLALFVGLGVALYFQRNRALEQEQLARETLSQSDFLQATEKMESGESGLGLAYLARAIRNTQHLPSARRAGFALLHEAWARPAAPIIEEDKIIQSTLSRDGRWIATVTESDRVSVWESQTSAKQYDLESEVVVQALYMSPDSKWLAIRTRSIEEAVDRIKLLELETGQSASPDLLHNRFDVVEFSQDGRFLGALLSDQSSVLWDTENRQFIKFPFESSIQSGLRIRFHPDGSRVATLTEGQMKFWSLPDLNELAQFDSAAWDFRYTADGSEIWAAFDSSLEFYDARTGQEVRDPWRPALPEDAMIWSYAGSTDQQFAYLAGAIGQTKGWVRRIDFSNGKETEIHRDPSAQTMSIELSRNNQFLRLWKSNFKSQLISAREQAKVPYLSIGSYDEGSFSQDGRTTAITHETGKTQLWTQSLGCALPGRVGPINGTISAAAFSDDGETLITGDWGTEVNVRSLKSGNLLYDPLPHPYSVYAVEISPNSETLLTVCSPGNEEPTGEVRLWNLGTGNPVTDPLKHEWKVERGIYSKDGGIFVTATGKNVLDTSEGYFQVWSKNGKPITTPIRLTSSIHTFSISPDGKNLVIGESSGGVAVYDTKTGSLSRRLLEADPEDSDLHPQIVEFHPSGESILGSPRWNDQGFVWDAATGNIEFVIQERTGITSAKYSPDGKWIAVAYGTPGFGSAYVRLLDAKTGKSVASRIPENTDLRIKDLQFTPDSSMLMTWSEEGTLQFWSTTSGSPLAPEIQFRANDLSEFPIRFNRHATRMIVPQNDGIELWSLAPNGPPPAWLPDLLEATGGNRLDESGVPIEVEKRYAQLRRLSAQLATEQLDDPWVKLGKWFLDDGPARTLSPDSTTTVREFIVNKVDQLNSEEDEARRAAIEQRIFLVDPAWIPPSR